MCKSLPLCNRKCTEMGPGLGSLDSAQTDYLRDTRGEEMEIIT